MTDDLLEKMSRALAEEHDGATALPEVTKARVLRSLVEKRKRKLRLAFGVPLFVTALGSSALATSGVSLSEIFANLRGDEAEEVERPMKELVASKRKATTVKAAEEHGGAGALVPTSATVPGAPEPRESEKPSVASVLPRDSRGSGVPTKRENAPRGASRISGPPEGSAPSTAFGTEAREAEESLGVYQAAHEAQFRRGDCGQALTDYERYLKAAPTGTFVIEARYNSAVCLVRLGENRRAKEALAPFRNGTYGEYRRAEAEALSQALSDIP